MNRDEMTTLLEEQFAKFAGQLIQHVDARIDAQTEELQAKFDERFDRLVDRLETMVDAVAERIATDDQERAAIISEQRRHGQWIGQLAEHTNVKLVPEQ